MTRNLKLNQDQTATGNTQFENAVRVPQSVANVTEAAPTDAQLDSAFGTPASLGRGFIGTVDDNDGSTGRDLYENGFRLANLAHLTEREVFAGEADGVCYFVLAITEEEACAKVAAWPESPTE